jgi:hypothetical protein
MKILIRGACVLIVAASAGASAIWWDSQPGGRYGVELNIFTFLAYLIEDRAFDLLCLILFAVAAVVLAPLFFGRRKRVTQ